MHTVTKVMMIKIVLITDDKYIVPTLVAISSMVKNKNHNSKYDITIIYDGCKQNELESMIKNYISQTVSINVIFFSKKITEKKCEHADKVGASNVSMYKFLLPELFPQYNKILYLDTDIIVKDDLSDLFSVELNDNYAAVVKDHWHYIHPDHYKKLGKSYNGYFNSGVMMLNLSKMREDDITAKLIHYRIYGYNVFMDQDAFNAVFDEKIIHLPLKYNMMCSLLLEKYPGILKNYYGLEIEEKDLLSYGIIIHFLFRKPWDYCNLGYNEYWDYYYNNLPHHPKLKRKSYKWEVFRKNLITIKNTIEYTISKLIKE